jgi:hypothetical protein
MRRRCARAGPCGAANRCFISRKYGSTNGTTRPICSAYGGRISRAPEPHPHRGGAIGCICDLIHTSYRRLHWCRSPCARPLAHAPIEVFVPTNAATIVKRMYGRNCLVEYRVESHVNEHHLLSQMFDVESRMKLHLFIKRTNMRIGLDRSRNIDGHLTGLFAKFTAELTVVSSSQKHARISQYVLDYLRANVLADYASVDTRLLCRRHDECRVERLCTHAQARTHAPL